MTPRTIKLLAPSKKLFLLALPLLIGLAMCVGAWAQVLTPPPTELRFQLLLNEPMAHWIADRWSPELRRCW